MNVYPITQSYVYQRYHVNARIRNGVSGLVQHHAVMASTREPENSGLETYFSVMTWRKLTARATLALVFLPPRRCVDPGQNGPSVIVTGH